MPDVSGFTAGFQVPDEQSPEQSIARLSVGRAAFVGRTLRGPEDRPIVIKNFQDFQQVFGGLWQPSLLGYAVEQFFDNGGREAVVVRVANGARCASLRLPAGEDQLQLHAQRPGTREFLRACVDYDNLPEGSAQYFNLTVQRVRTQAAERVEDQEIYRGLSVDPESPRFAGTALATSQLVRLQGRVPATRPDRTLDPASGIATGYLHSNSDGDDGAPLTDYDLIGRPDDRTGLFALDGIDHFSFLVIPPISREQDLGFSTLLVAARYCRRRQALLLVDPPHAWATADEALRGAREWGFASEDACMFFPRILAHDKLRGRFETFAPCGAVAGLLARADAVAPAWATGAGEALVLRPGLRPTCIVAADRRAKLAALGINTLQGVRSPGHDNPVARTLAAGSAGSSDWRFLATRRFALSVVSSISAGTRWAARARPQTEAGAIVEAEVRAFLERLREAGCFADRLAEDAYYVICDARLNARPLRDADADAFHVLVGIAAERPGEFHSYRISHSAAGSEIHAVTLNRLNRQPCSPADTQWVDRLARDLDPDNPWP
jgi:hypothetical protein